MKRHDLVDHFSYANAGSKRYIISSDMNNGLYLCTVDTEKKAMMIVLALNFYCAYFDPERHG